MDGAVLREVMRAFATGVTIVSTFTDTPDGRHHDAMTANSLLSVSLDPPLVSVSVHVGSRFLADLTDTQVWAVSILNADGEALARVCALDRDARRADIRRMPAWPGPLTGALLVEGAGGWLECRYRNHLQVGDHVLVIGEVIAAYPTQEFDPLVFVGGRFHTLGETS